MVITSCIGHIYIYKTDIYIYIDDFEELCFSAHLDQPMFVTGMPGKPLNSTHPLDMDDGGSAKIRRVPSQKESGPVHWSHPIRWIYLAGCSQFPVHRFCRNPHVCN